jgi:hypothetical protein
MPFNMKKLLILPLLMIASFCFAQDAEEIIGKPIKIGNILVAENDIPEDLNLEDAKKACQALGKGWRLPTYAEMNIIFKNRDKIGGFEENMYWTSSVLNSNLGVSFKFWYSSKNSKLGHKGSSQKSFLLYVRAVKFL